MESDSKSVDHHVFTISGFFMDRLLKKTPFFAENPVKFMKPVHILKVGSVQLVRDGRY